MQRNKFDLGNVENFPENILSMLVLLSVSDKIRQEKYPKRVSIKISLKIIKEYMKKLYFIFVRNKTLWLKMLTLCQSQ